MVRALIFHTIDANLKKKVTFNVVFLPLLLKHLKARAFEIVRNLEVFRFRYHLSKCRRIQLLANTHLSKTLAILFQ